MTYTISVELYELYDPRLHWTCIAEEMTLLQVTLIMITLQYNKTYQNITDNTPPHCILQIVTQCGNIKGVTQYTH